MSAKIVAEIGAVHLGSLDRAKMLADLARLAGADYLKLQKRNPIESVPKEIQNKPHPNQMFAYGDTYLEHRIALELNIDQHMELQMYCKDIGIGYTSSVWDITSAREIIQLNPDFIKVPSPCNTHYKMLDILCQEYSGQIHISSGMTTAEEMHELKAYLNRAKLEDGRIVVYHCTSEYPCPFERLYLKEFEKLRYMFPSCDLGYSNHGLGIATEIVTYMLGTRWFERHFIDDRTIKHSDASASLEPDGLRRLCRDLKMLPKALQYKKEMSAEEMQQRKKLKFRDD